MYDKKERFLKRALETLPKLQKDELIKLAKALIEDRKVLIDIIDSIPFAISCIKGNQVILQNKKMQILYQEIPYLGNYSQTLVIIKDIYGNDRILKFDRIELADLELLIIEDKDTKLEKEEQSIDALETLATGIAHEIKNPLSAIDIHTQVIQRQISKNQIQVPDIIQEYFSIIQKETARLLETLENFLHIARKNIPKYEFVEISDVLSHIVDVFREELIARKIALNLSFSAVPKVFTSSLAIQQIMSDLIRNAIEALDNVEERYISLSVRENQEKNTVCIELEDSGEGIQPEATMRIFEPYFTTKKNGTGLGLTFVKKLTQEIGGTISIKTGSLNGTCFILEIPISQGQKKLMYRDTI